MDALSKIFDDIHLNKSEYIYLKPQGDWAYAYQEQGAMIGYVVLLISFPVQMTSWLPPHEIAATVPGFFDALNVILSGHTVSGGDMNTLRMGIDGISQATPLDTFKTSLHAGHTVEQVMQYPIYSGVLAGAGWQWVNLAYLLGGAFLLQQKAIRWHKSKSN